MKIKIIRFVVDIGWAVQVAMGGINLVIAFRGMEVYSIKQPDFGNLFLIAFQVAIGVFILANCLYEKQLNNANKQSRECLDAAAEASARVWGMAYGIERILNEHIDEDKRAAIRGELISIATEASDRKIKERHCSD